MQNDLGDFLRSRRSRIQPADAGLREYGRRRVPGLRREEVAQLAGVTSQLGATLLAAIRLRLDMNRSRVRS
ncbi:hypothetical protein [Nocardia tengchongensis]